MKRTVLKARTAGVVGLASVSMFALAACGGGSGEVTTGGDGEETTTESSEAATTEAETSEAATSEAATSEAAGSGELQAATDADIEPTKQLVVDFYDKAANGDFAGACQLALDPSTNVGMAEGSPSYGACTQAMEGQKETFAQVKGMMTLDIVDASVDPDGRLSIKIGGTDSGLKAAKGADGKVYIDLLGSVG